MLGIKGISRKLWLGFGTVTGLLIVSLAAMLMSLRTAERNVVQLTRFVGRRIAAVHALETDVFRYALAVQEYADTADPLAAVDAKNAAFRIEEQDAIYRRLASVPPQREMAARFGATWQELRRSGDAVLGRPQGEAAPDELRAFRELRGELEDLLSREMRADAGRRYSARSESTLASIQSSVGIAGFLLLVGGPLAALLGAFVIRRVVRAEREIRESEELLRLALESARIGMWSVKLGSGVTDCTPLMKSLFGLAPESLTPVGQQWIHSIHPEDRAMVQAAWDNSLAHLTPFTVEFRVFWPDGSLHWLDSRGRALLNRKDKVVGVVGVTMEISDRKKRETNARFLAEASTALAALADPEATLRQIARLAVPTIADFCAVDLRQADGSLSRVAMARTDRTPELVSGDPDRRCVQDHWTAASDAPGMTDKWRLEGPHELPDRLSMKKPEYLQRLRELGLRSYIGVPLTVRRRVIGVLTLIAAESGRGYDADDLAMAEDLTKRISIAIENSQLYEEIGQADRRKDEFLATLAHELRNPLAPIRNCVHLLQLTGTSELKLAELGDMIERQVNFMTRLVDDLMDLSRIRQGKIHLRRDDVSLAEVVQQAVETSRPLIEAHGHELTVTLPPQQLVVAGDKVRLSQVLGNLLNNAAKYTPEHGHIWLTVERVGQQAEIRVRDNGLGIPPSMLGNVFEMFSQVGRHRGRAQGGLGIGLALVKRLVEMHGGTIEAHSAGEGQGAEFVLRLPAIRSSGRVERFLALPDRRSGAPLRALVVDDNVDAARSHALLLKALGHEVRMAYDGRTAVAHAQAFKPDVILLDLEMPEIDGFETIRRIRELPEGLWATLVAVTGWGQAEQLKRTQQAGFDFHLVKPVEMSALQDVLAHVSNLASASQRQTAPRLAAPVPR